MTEKVCQMRKKNFLAWWYKNLYLYLHCYFLDEHEPIHVHINANGKLAKIALDPEIELIYNHGLKEQELKKGHRNIYGISKPSEQRLKQIREAFHFFGRELLTA